jgi:hypothetical protein
MAMTDASSQETGQAAKAKVFLSYSRKDVAFIDQLDAALKARGFEPLIDRSDIYAFEEWWQRIQALIARADTVVFVLSPDAVASDVARREVTYAASLNKRFAPIVYRRVDDKQLPEALAKLNFIFFDEAARFEHSADQLAEALTTDIGWVRQHTDFGEQGRRWAAVSEPSGLLLRSPVLEQAERWIASRTERSACAYGRDTAVHQKEPTRRDAAAEHSDGQSGRWTGASACARRVGVLAAWRSHGATQHRAAERGTGEGRKRSRDKKFQAGSKNSREPCLRHRSGIAQCRGDECADGAQNS